MLSRIERFSLYLIIYAKLIGTTTLGLGFATLLSLRNLFLSEREAWFITAAIGQLLIALVLSASTAPLGNALFYFSFLPVYLLLKAKRPEALILFLQGLLLLLLVFSACEFFLLNTPLSRYVWYLPQGHVHRSMIMNLQRAQGLAAISSSSGAVSVLCLALYTTVAKEKVRYYTAITAATILLLMSGTGFFLFLAYVILRRLRARSGVTLKVAAVGFLAVVAMISFMVFAAIGLNRFTTKYFVEIVVVKATQYAVYSGDITAGSSILGGQADPIHPKLLSSTDFAVMGLFQSMGLVGTILVLLAPFILIGYRKQYWTLLVLCYLSWLHYPALASPIGAVFLGLFLALYRWTPKGPSYAVESVKA